jgi:predicted metalloprotease with PDZ domain
MAALLAAAAAAAVPARAAPPAGAGTPAVRAGDEADLDARLEDARSRLEQAAHDVASLTSQLSGTLVDEVLPYVEPGHAIVGVQLEPAGAGARVRKVSPGGPAAEAGVRAGDVIVAMNGKELKDKSPTRELVRLLRDVKPDSQVGLRVLREGKMRDFTLTSRAAPGLANVRVLPDLDVDVLPDLPHLRGAFLFHTALTDMELATLTPRLGSYFGTDHGVLVVRAPADGALKLEDGDVILAIDGRAPTSGSHATRILGSYQPGEKLTLHIVREHKTLDLDATLPERTERSGRNTLWYQGPPRDRAWALDVGPRP